MLVIVSRTFLWLENKFIYAVYGYISDMGCVCASAVYVKTTECICVILSRSTSELLMIIYFIMSTFVSFFPSLNTLVLSDTILFFYLLYQRLWTNQHQNDNNPMTTKHLILKSIYVFDSTTQSVKSNYYVLNSFGIYFISDYTSNGRRISFACFTCRFLMIAFQLNFI